jgi:hypothetical protein
MLLPAEHLEKFIFYRIIHTTYDINSGKYYIMLHHGLRTSNDDDDDSGGSGGGGGGGSGNNSILMYLRGNLRALTSITKLA